MTMKVLLVVVVVAAVGVTGRPRDGNQNQQEGTHGSKDPVFNIWEFAISNSKYNPRRETSTQKEPCTWAIVRCCMAPDRAAQDSCFADNGCPGAWFNDLCSDHFRGLVRNVVHDAFSGGF